MVEQKLVIRSNPVVRGSNPGAQGSNPVTKALTSSANDLKRVRGGSNPVRAPAARGRGGPIFRNPQRRAMLVSRSR